MKFVAFASCLLLLATTEAQEKRSLRAAIVLTAFFANFESTDTTDIRTYFTYHTRFGLAAMGFWIPVGASMFMAICVFWWLHIKQVFKN